jgi:hypothetical protein
VQAQADLKDGSCPSAETASVQVTLGIPDFSMAEVTAIVEEEDTSRGVKVLASSFELSPVGIQEKGTTVIRKKTDKRTPSGVPTEEYLDEIEVVRAQTFLVDGDNTLAEIAVLEAPSGIFSPTEIVNGVDGENEPIGVKGLVSSFELSSASIEGKRATATANTSEECNLHSMPTDEFLDQIEVLREQMIFGDGGSASAEIAVVGETSGLPVFSPTEGVNGFDEEDISMKVKALVSSFEEQSMAVKEKEIAVTVNTIDECSLHSMPTDEYLDQFEVVQAQSDLMDASVEIAFVEETSGMHVFLPADAVSISIVEDEYKTIGVKRLTSSCELSSVALQEKSSTAIVNITEECVPPSCSTDESLDQIEDEKNSMAEGRVSAEICVAEEKPCNPPAEEAVNVVKADDASRSASSLELPTIAVQEKLPIARSEECVPPSMLTDESLPEIADVATQIDIVGGDRLSAESCVVEEKPEHPYLSQMDEVSMIVEEEKTRSEEFVPPSMLTDESLERIHDVTTQTNDIDGRGLSADFPVAEEMLGSPDLSPIEEVVKVVGEEDTPNVPAALTSCLEVAAAIVLEDSITTMSEERVTPRVLTDDSPDRNEDVTFQMYVIAGGLVSAEIAVVEEKPEEPDFSPLEKVVNAVEEEYTRNEDCVPPSMLTEAHDQIEDVTTQTSVVDGDELSADVPVAEEMLGSPDLSPIEEIADVLDAEDAPNAPAALTSCLEVAAAIVLEDSITTTSEVRVSPRVLTDDSPDRNEDVTSQIDVIAGGLASAASAEIAVVEEKPEEPDFSPMEVVVYVVEEENTRCEECVSPSMLTEAHEQIEDVTTLTSVVDGDELSADIPVAEDMLGSPEISLIKEVVKVVGEEDTQNAPAALTSCLEVAAAIVLEESSTTMSEERVSPRVLTDDSPDQNEDVTSQMYVIAGGLVSAEIAVSDRNEDGASQLYVIAGGLASAEIAVVEEKPEEPDFSPLEKDGNVVEEENTRTEEFDPPSMLTDESLERIHDVTTQTNDVDGDELSADIPVAEEMLGSPDLSPIKEIADVLDEEDTPNVPAALTSRLEVAAAIALEESITTMSGERVSPCVLTDDSPDRNEDGASQIDVIAGGFASAASAEIAVVEEKPDEPDFSPMEVVDIALVIDAVERDAMSASPVASELVITAVSTDEAFLSHSRYVVPAAAVFDEWGPSLHNTNAAAHVFTVEGVDSAEIAVVEDPSMRPDVMINDLSNSVPANITAENQVTVRPLEADLDRDAAAEPGRYLESIDTAISIDTIAFFAPRSVLSPAAATFNEWGPSFQAPYEAESATSFELLTANTDLEVGDSTGIPIVENLLFVESDLSHTELAEGVAQPDEMESDAATPCLSEGSSSSDPFDQLLEVATVEGTTNATSEGECCPPPPPPHIGEMQTASTGSNEANTTAEPEMFSVNASGSMDESHVDRQASMVSKVSLETTQDFSPIPSPASSNQTKPPPSEDPVSCANCGCGFLLAFRS